MHVGGGGDGDGRAGLALDAARKRRTSGKASKCQWAGWITRCKIKVQVYKVHMYLVLAGGVEGSRRRKEVHPCLRVAKAPAHAWIKLGAAGVGLPRCTYQLHVLLSCALRRRAGWSLWEPTSCLSCFVDQSWPANQQPPSVAHLIGERMNIRTLFD
jgi:hypothetical protein